MKRHKALALLADCLGDDEQAVQFNQEFKRTVMANLDGRGWIITNHEIRARVRRLAQVERRS